MRDSFKENAAAIQRILDRVGRLGFDLRSEWGTVLALPVGGSEAQLEILGKLEALNPPTEKLPPAALRFTAKTVLQSFAVGAAGYGVASLAVSVGAPSTFLGWDSASEMGLFCSSLWAGAKSLWDQCVETRRRECRNRPSKNGLFFRSLREHERLIQEPWQKGAWVYSSTRVQDDCVAPGIEIDLFTFVGGDDSDPHARMWLFLRKPPL